MLKTLLIHLLRREATQRVGASKTLDWRVGVRLWGDSRVPMTAKFQAIALGLIGLTLLNVLQIPLDALLIWLLPLVGLVVDFAWNGLELLVVPFVISTLALPFLAPRELSAPQTVPIPPDGKGHVYNAPASHVR